MKLYIEKNVYMILGVQIHLLQEFYFPNWENKSLGDVSLHWETNFPSLEILAGG